MQQNTDIDRARMELCEQLTRYCLRYPSEQSAAQRMLEFVSRQPGCFERSTREGHLTGSAWILHPSEDLVLLTHHAKLNKWLQLGGHADGNINLLDVALCEAKEESGISEISILTHEIFDIDIHPIPARGPDPEHLHYDVRFLLRAHSEEYRVSHESHDLAWLAPMSISALTNEFSMLRMADKWNAIKHQY
jgi:8-oxo-dGTP pyrophosphatase MutT (NUDIX family)